MSDVLARQEQETAPTCGPHDDAAIVQKTMLENCLSSIAVVENGRLLGIASYGEVTIAVGEGDSGVYADGKFAMGAMGK